MKIENKLVIFEQITMQEVEKKRQQTTKEMNEAFDTAVDEAVRHAERNAQERIRTERYAIDRKKNKEIVTASAEAKRGLIAKREKLTDELFAEVAAEVAAFVASPAYVDYLLDTIRRVVSVEPGRYAYVALPPRDMELASRINALSGLTAEAMTTDRAASPCIGGFKLMTPDRRAVADYTLDTRIAEERRCFSIVYNQDMCHEEA